jgi:thioesterase domain-containing protein
LAVLETETVTQTQDSRPANAVEVELSRIWQRIFRIDHIGRQDNFFSLGGNSILATQLVTEIDTLLNCRLHITELFESPTVESLAQRLSDKGWTPHWRALVPLQTEGSKPPIFFVHGIEGDLYHFVRLLPLLGPDQPSYGVHGAGLDPELAHALSIEEIAAHYAHELASFHKEGPFYLVGYSLGGMVAFEIAQQLIRLGREVAFLGLLDSWLMAAAPKYIYPLAVAMYLPKRCAELYRQWCALPRGQKLSFIRERWENFVYGFLKRERRTPATLSSSEDVHELKGDADPYMRASRSYHFKPYPGVLDIFVGDDTTYIESRFYWKHLADGVSYHRIPGGHLEVFSQDNLAALAKSLAFAVRNRTEN